MSAGADPSFWRSVNERAEGLLGQPVTGLNQFAGLLSGTVTPQEFGKIRGEQILGQLQPTPENALNLMPMMKAATVFHGSPHKFDQFDMSKIGTGEGAQAYGHGLYFAESPEVALQYQKQLSQDVFKAGDGSLFDPSKLGHLNVRNAARTGDLDAAIAKAESIASSGSPVANVAAQDLQTLNKLKASGGISAHSGSLYRVDLPDEHIAKMLDWDKPLNQQAGVQEAFKRARDAAGMNNDYWKPGNLATGSVEYGKLESVVGKARASQLLQEQGIPGIRYLDGGSRGMGAGTRNYVVFDDKLPKILSRE